MTKITFLRNYIINRCLVSKTKLLFVMLFTVSIAFAQVPGGYVAKYDFNNNLDDTVSGLPFTTSNSSLNALQYVNDRLSQANSALQVNSGTGPNHGGGNLRGYELHSIDTSISFWMKASNSNNVTILKARSNVFSGFEFGSFTNATQQHFSVSVSNGGGNIQYSVDVPSLFNNQWHHIVLTLKKLPGGMGYETNVYLDGSKNNTLSSNLAISGNDHVFNASRRAVLEIQARSPAFEGSVDDILIYNRALSNQEILDIYNYNPNPKTIYVNINATGNNNGTSWADAYTNIPSALSNCYSGDEIWVAQGKYTASTNAAPFVNIDKANMKIYGGFNGTENSLNQRDFIANETILSGDIAQPDVPQNSFVNYINAGSRTDNSQFIINVLAGGENLLLDGFTISDAHNISSNLGAAIIKNPTIEKLTIKNCVIKNNVCRGAGTGIFAEFEAPTNTTSFNGELNIQNCRFSNNWGAFATGVYSINKGTGHDMDVNISNSLFDNNHASNGSFAVGGISSPAIWLRNFSNQPTINATTNTRTFLTAIITNCTFANNIDSGSSSGITLTNKSVVSVSKNWGANSAELQFKNNIFYGNNDGSGNVVKPYTQSIGSFGVDELDIDNSLSEQAWGILPATSVNNIDGNPLFTDASNGDFTLQSISPAIEAGLNSAAIGTTDLLNNQRIFNAIIDMGAYEFGSSPVLSIDDFNATVNEIKLYPNPTTSILNIEMSSNLKQATVYSILGAKVLQTASKTINTSNLKQGVYLIKIEDETGSVSTKRFVKQ